TSPHPARSRRVGPSGPRSRGPRARSGRDLRPMRLGVAKALVGGEWVDGDVEVLDGRIAAVGLGAPSGSKLAAPGFVDLQVNGYAGVDFSAPGEDGYARAGAALLAGGVPAFQPTLVTAPSAEMIEALGAVAAAAAAGGPRI